MASILRKLNIQTVEVGLNVVAIYNNGMIYTKDALSLVGQVYIDRLIQAFNNAINLSVSISYPTKENIKYLLSKAYQQAKALEGLGGAN